MSDYIPIPCGMHDEFESAIVRKQYLTIELFTRKHQWLTMKIMPKDTKTVAGEEFLLYKIDGDNELKQIRLDKIKLIK